MSVIDLFHFKDYREYLRVEFAGTGKNRGRRATLSEYLRCQTSFLSQVFTDRAHLSLEHALQTAAFLNLSELEKKYFMLLVQKGKAGSKDLASYFEEEILRIQNDRENIKERININTKLSAEDQMKYYSTWYYSAIHVLCALPNLNHSEAIAIKLKLEPAIVKESLQFLEERGFVLRKGGTYQIGATRIHLPKGSSMLPRHHSNWRIKAIEAVDHEKSNDLHYSAILGISKRDTKLFKEKLLQLLQEFETIITDSTAEVPIVLIMDLFGL